MGKENDVLIRIDSVCGVCGEKYEFIAVVYHDGTKQCAHEGLEICIDCIDKIRNTLKRVEKR